MIEAAAVQDLLGRWWFNYDEGNFDVLTTLLTGDVRFASRTDSGTTNYEDFVRADLRGRDAVMAWQRQHRLDSPYPLRHNATNVHVDAASDQVVRFSSYIFVTQIADGVTNLSSGIVTGAARVEGGALRIAALDVTLDTEPSAPLRERR